MCRGVFFLPNLLMARIDRGVTDVAAGAECVRVRVEKQLVLALFGFENMELAGVCFERGRRLHLVQCATLMVLSGISRKIVSRGAWAVRSMMFCQGRSHSLCFSGRVALQTLEARAPPCLEQQLFHNREVYL